MIDWVIWSRSWNKKLTNLPNSNESNGANGLLRYIPKNANRKERDVSPFNTPRAHFRFSVVSMNILIWESLELVSWLMDRHKSLWPTLPDNLIWTNQLLTYKEKISTWILLRRFWCDPPRCEWRGQYLGFACSFSLRSHCWCSTLGRWLLRRGITNSVVWVSCYNGNLPILPQRLKRHLDKHGNGSDLLELPGWALIWIQCHKSITIQSLVWSINHIKYENRFSHFKLHCNLTWLPPNLSSNHWSQSKHGLKRLNMFFSFRRNNEWLHWAGEICLVPIENHPKSRPSLYSPVIHLDGPKQLRATSCINPVQWKCIAFPAASAALLMQDA